MIEEKNNDKSSLQETEIEEGFFVLRFQNETAGVLNEQKAVSSNFIQFHFCMKGRGDFLFNNGNYKFPVEEEHNILLFNPQQDLPINLQLESNSWMVSVLISIKKFHLCARCYLKLCLPDKRFQHNRRNYLLFRSNSLG